MTSRPFGLGEGLALTKIKNNAEFLQQAEVFNRTHASKEEIAEAVEIALVLLYGGGKDDGLDILRYRRFCDKISKGTSHI